jgi:surface protein
MLNNHGRDFSEYILSKNEYATALVGTEFEKQYNEYLVTQAWLKEREALELRLANLSVNLDDISSNISGEIALNIKMEVSKSMLNGVASLNNKFSEEAFGSNRAISPHVAMQKRLEELSALIENEGRELDKFLIRAMAKESINIENLDVSNITDLSDTFGSIHFFNQDISKWDVGKVTDMEYMFYKCDVFNQNINSWNVSNVTNMTGIFDGCVSFDQPLNNWNVSNVTKMNNMFSDCYVFDQPLYNWNTSKVVDMSIMFSTCRSFNQNINSWDVSNVIDMGYMFDETDKFNQPLNNWNVGSVADMSCMFYNSLCFNQPLDHWDVSNVDSMSEMFNNTQLFKQYLGDWEFDQNCHKPYINGIEFYVHNSRCKFTKYKLECTINKYIDDKSEQNKYDLMKYIKQYSQHNNEELITYLTDLKLNIHINYIDKTV